MKQPVPCRPLADSHLPETAQCDCPKDCTGYGSRKRKSAEPPSCRMNNNGPRNYCHKRAQHGTIRQTRFKLSAAHKVTRQANYNHRRVGSEQGDYRRDRKEITSCTLRVGSNQSDYNCCGCWRDAQCKRNPPQGWISPGDVVDGHTLTIAKERPISTSSPRSGPSEPTKLPDSCTPGRGRGSRRAAAAHLRPLQPTKRLPDSGHCIGRAKKHLMLYVVGGCSRSGKSILAERICARHGVPWFSLDALKLSEFLIADTLTARQDSGMDMPFQPGDVLTVSWDNRPIRVLQTDAIETLYDAEMEELGWIIAKARTATYYRTSTRPINKTASIASLRPFSEKEDKRFRPDFRCACLGIMKPIGRMNCKP